MPRRRPELAPLVEIARAARGRQRREELSPVALTMHSLVEQSDDAVVLARADETAETLLQRDLRQGYVELGLRRLLRTLPRLSTTDVADALQVARARILGYLQRRRVIHIDDDDAQRALPPESCGPPPPCGTTGSRYRPWAELLKRTFGIDVETCPRCGGRMRLLALITAPERRPHLRHLGEVTDPPPRAPARDPPFWQSRVLRRRHEQQSAQRGLVEEH